MAKQRMIQTSLWKNSRKFKQLGPLERFLYLYLLTNEDTELCGAYEQSLEEIALHTGIHYKIVGDMFIRLEEVGLAAFKDGWIVIADDNRTSSSQQSE